MASGNMELSVRREIRHYPEDMKTSSLAVSALILARRLDGGLPAREIAGVARELRITMQQLSEKAPKAKPNDKSDELRIRRQRRITKSAAADG